MVSPSSKSPRHAAVGIVYPSSSAPEERVALGVARLEEWGLKPRFFRPAGPAEDFLASADATRAAALQAALDDETVSLIWAARGGYGSVRLLPLLQLPVRRHPAILLGFSDVSLLLAEAAQRHGWAAVHGPNVSTLPRLDGNSLGALRHFLESETFLPIAGLRCVRPGRVRGPLLPMNLTMLLSVVGTPFEVDLEGAILVLEDTGEAPYRLDRMLQQLGYLARSRCLAGLVIGDLAGFGEHPEIRRTIAALATRLEIPCCTGAPVGHGPANWPLPVGSPGTLDSVVGRLDPDPIT